MSNTIVAMIIPGTKRVVLRCAETTIASPCPAGSNGDRYGFRVRYSPAESHLRLGVHFASSGRDTLAEQEYLAAKSGYYLVEAELLYATGSEEIYGGL